MSSQPVLPDLLYLALVNFYVGKYFKFVFKSIRGPCSNLLDAIRLCKVSQHEYGSLLVTAKMEPLNYSYDNLITILQQLCHRHSEKQLKGNNDTEYLLCTPCDQNASNSSLYDDNTSASYSPLVQLYSIDDLARSSSYFSNSVVSDAVIETEEPAIDPNLSSLPSQEQRNLIEQLTNDETKNYEVVQLKEEVSKSIENEVVTELKTEWEELQDQSLSSTSSILSPFWAQLPTQRQYLSSDNESCCDKDNTPLLASHGESFTPELFQSLHHQSSTDKLHHTPTGPRTFRRIELNYTSTPRSLDKKELRVSIPFKTPIRLNGGGNACDSFSPDLF